MARGSSATLALLATAVLTRTTNLANLIFPFAGLLLLVRGEWRSLVLGMVIMMAGHFLLPFFLVLPGLILAGRARQGTSRWQFLLVKAWSVAIIAGWCIGGLLAFLRLTPSENRVPVLLWSYITVSGIWAYAASKERGHNVSSTIWATVAQTGYLVMICSVLLLGSSTLAAPGGFLVVCALGFLADVILSPSPPVHLPAERSGADPDV